MASVESTRSLGITGSQILAAYLKKEYSECARLVVNTLVYYSEVGYESISADDLVKLNELIGTILWLYTRDDWMFSGAYDYPLIAMNHILANLVGITPYGTTDSQLLVASGQERNFVRMLSLLTCRNKPFVRHPANILFEKFPELATFWWLNYQTSPCGFNTKLVWENVYNHLMAGVPPLKLVDLRVQPLYFQTSYIMPCERPVKEALNKEVRRLLGNVRFEHNPDPKSIAIITDRWQKTTAVYKSAFHQIEALKKHGYRLTLVHAHDHPEQFDQSLFSDIKKVDWGKLPDGNRDLRLVDVSSIQKNDFQLAYFADIGMSDISVALSNMQIAPIMAMGYGHPSSTFGSLVDYFVVGEVTERLEYAEELYGERLVVIPGTGAHPVDPKYIKKWPPRDDIVRINCCWTAPKINYPMLTLLQNVKKRSKNPVVVRFFPSWTVCRYNGYITMRREMNDLFGENGWEVITERPYQEYLSYLELGSFGLDSYPFGGYNTIVDNLFTGCPVVTLEGNRFFNRASSALNRIIGCEQNICHSLAEAEAKCLELADNPDLLAAQRDYLANLDLRKLLIDTEDPDNFAKAIDYIMANHDTLKADGTRKPVMIGA
ncbi:MAG: hypothetical protein AMXMBFR16_10630 [Candidatus Uhrbacteria bacterium]